MACEEDGFWPFFLLLSTPMLTGPLSFSEYLPLTCLKKGHIVRLSWASIPGRLGQGTAWWERKYSKHLVLQTLSLSPVASASSAAFARVSIVAQCSLFSLL